jgi:type I restriction-modification system DNA methylase subunit
MSLFQKSVVNKYLKNLNKQILLEKWNAYKNHFLNPSVQFDIRNLKEEQYQGEFLEDLFVKILNYTKPASSSETKFNLTTEYKNVKDSKKADGAIIFNDKVKAVIELKGTNTTDLGKIESQAFGYKNNQPDCVYVITSNFEKLRFYIDNAIEHIEFNLFTLTEEEFQLLYLCLAFENLSQNIGKKIKDESLSEEDVITKKLYKDYSLFKRELYQNLVLLNPDFEPLELFKKSQKLLDRFLFLFFGEDRHLLPPNSVRQIITDWDKLQELDVYIPLYERFKQYFSYLNSGYKGKNYEVYAYNGGLFKPDEILDTIIINDDLLYKHTLKLSEYDFASEVDVNILGHIFENSLNELDEIKAQLEGQQIDKSKTKRKKDGVFYTPKYITKYIVENTVGKLCEDKKQALEILEEEYFTDKKRQKKAIQELVGKLDTYRKWLLEITICDPACGSGAFLNQALDFLIKEHQYIDELKAKLFGDTLVLNDCEKSILENNLFGVDLNEESVEIAKLSLWLRTAQPNRKLNDLNGNIKCGNSLIDDVAISGDKAFNWQQAFPKVFEKGGFDVIIGNPPYVRKQGLMQHYPELCLYYEKEYKSATSNYDIYALFMEKSFYLINDKGIVSFILPHKFLVSDFGVGIREFFKNKTAVDKLVHFGSEIVFQEAATYTCIIDLTKVAKDKVRFKKINPKDIFEHFVWDEMSYKNLNETNWDLQNEKVFDVINKLKLQPYTIENVFDKIFQGIASGGDKFFTLQLIQKNGNLGQFYSEILEKEVTIEFGLLKPFIKGNQISKYKKLENTFFSLFPYKIVDNKTIALSIDEIRIDYPNAYEYFLANEKFLRERENGRFNNDNEWFLFSRKQGINGVEFPKIMTQEISLGCNMTFDEKGEYYHPTTIYSFVKNDKFIVDDKYYLGILNSKVMWFFLKNTGTELGGGYFRFKTNYLKPFPLPEISNNSEIMVGNVNKLLSLNKELQEQSHKVQRTIQRKFGIEELPKKLQDWYLLTYTDFIKELSKKKEKLSLSQEAEWEDYFIEESKKAQQLKATIDITDKAIDALVYELYGLSIEEITIIENS